MIGTNSQGNLIVHCKQTQFMGKYRLLTSLSSAGALNIMTYDRLAYSLHSYKSGEALISSAGEAVSLSSAVWFAWCLPVHDQDYA